MRYQLPDGMTSISAAGHSFEADVDGVIEVAHDIGAEVHRDLQDTRLWGLTALDDVAGAEVTGPLAVQIAAVEAPPTEPAVPMREHKQNLLKLLRGFGHVLDGRATFEFLRRKAMTILHEMDPESLAAAKAATAPVSDPATGTEPPATGEGAGATTDSVQEADPAASTGDTPSDTPAKDPAAEKTAEPPAAPSQGDPAATPPADPQAPPGP